MSLILDELRGYEGGIGRTEQRVTENQEAFCLQGIGVDLQLTCVTGACEDPPKNMDAWIDGAIREPG